MLDRTLRDILGQEAGALGEPGWSPTLHPPAYHDWTPALSEPRVPFAWPATLERERSDVASLARFAYRVDYATFHLCAAFEKSEVRDFALSRPRNVVRASRGISTWYAQLVNATFSRYRDLRNALVHPWTPHAGVEPLVFQAFFTLCELTPADSQLRALFVTDRSRAFLELAMQLDIVAEQLKSAIRLAENLDPIDADETSESRAALDAVQADILGKAGEPLTLTGAASRLGITRQALHKRIQAGTALGLMRGAELVIPSVQFIERDGKPRIVEGMGEIVTLFDAAGAGRWSALQFLTHVDPSLRAVPIDVLKRGDGEAVVAAARGYLSVDEG